MGKIAWMGVFFSVWLGGAVAAQELNDVSILIPLPPVSEFPLLLAPTSKGIKGELLSRDVYRYFPVLDSAANPDSVYDFNLKVVGIRLDPCFREGTSLACRRQVRLVWQPLVEGRDGTGGTKTSTLDAAVHTFYEFNETEWKQLYAEWGKVAQGPLQLKSNLPLQIHPRLRVEGFQGVYWNALKSLILKHCGDQNLIRATTMSVSRQMTWTFVGFDKTIDATDGKPKWSYIRIATINRPTQTFFLTFDGLFELSEFTGGFGPVPSGQEAWYRLTSDSKKFKETQKESDLKLVVNRAFQLENPSMHNPGTADCVSCHLAQTVRLWGEKRFPQWNWKSEFSKSHYTSSENLTNLSVNASHTNRVRAFGYFDDEPIFSQRAVNETADVVKFLKTH